MTTTAFSFLNCILVCSLTTTDQRGRTGWYCNLQFSNFYLSYNWSCPQWECPSCPITGPEDLSNIWYRGLWKKRNWFRCPWSSFLAPRAHDSMPYPNITARMWSLWTRTLFLQLLLYPVPLSSIPATLDLLLQRFQNPVVLRVSTTIIWT